jgi:uncharacterized protein (DUF1778 family)
MATRNDVINIRVNRENKELFSKACKSKGQTISQSITMYILEEIKKNQSASK